MNRTRLATTLLALLVFSPLTASAASIYLDPNTGTYGPGDTFEVDVRLNTDSSQCINAGHIEIDYPTAALRAVDFGRGDSIFTLWIADPHIDADKGTVDFSGGTPGGYCGRIPGDPSLSNILGKIIFTVMSSSTKSATVHLSSSSNLYANDGLGTVITPSMSDATITIAPHALSTSNPWLTEVSKDTIPPDPFDIQVESTRGVFGGRYYAVFSTVDKQSGLDHFEILEDGVWKNVVSPHELADQSLTGGVQIKAIDKAGNERLGTYVEGSAPRRIYSIEDFLLPVGALIILLILIGIYLSVHRKRNAGSVVDLRHE